MSQVCKKHQEKPVKIYSKCIGCEVENLNQRIREQEELLRWFREKNEPHVIERFIQRLLIKELEEQRDKLTEWIKTALVGAMKESCMHDTTDPTWHCCDWAELVDQAKEIGVNVTTTLSVEEQNELLKKVAESYARIISDLEEDCEKYFDQRNRLIECLRFYERLARGREVNDGGRRARTLLAEIGVMVK